MNLETRALARAALAVAAALAASIATPADAQRASSKTGAAPLVPAAAAPKSGAPAAKAPPVSATPAAATPKAAAEVPLPPPPEGTRLERRRDATMGLAVGPWVAFDTGKSVALQLDYGYTRTPASWQKLQLEVRLAVTLARPTEDTSLTTTYVPPYYPYTPVVIDAGTEDMRAWVFEVVPTARIRMQLRPKFALFADAGLGIAQTLERYEREEMFQGRTVTTKNVTGLVLRAGGGLSFDVHERVRVLFVPVALAIHLGPDFSAFTPYLGVAYRL